MNLTQTETTATIHLDDNRKLTLNFKGIKFTSREEFYSYVYFKIIIYLLDNQLLDGGKRDAIAKKYSDKIVDSKLYLIEREE